MKITNPLPPSGRDFEVYRLFHVEGSSTRTVALGMQLSQTRVCQIAEKVGQYLTSVAPAKEDQQRDKQLAVAEQVAALRVDFLYGAALQSWRGPQGTQTTTRELISAMKAFLTVKTTRNSPGDSRHSPRESTCFHGVKADDILFAVPSDCGIYYPFAAAGCWFVSRRRASKTDFS